MGNLAELDISNAAFFLFLEEMSHRELPPEFWGEYKQIHDHHFIPRFNVICGSGCCVEIYFLLTEAVVGAFGVPRQCQFVYADPDFVDKLVDYTLHLVGLHRVHWPNFDHKGLKRHPNSQLPFSCNKEL